MTGRTALMVAGLLGSLMLAAPASAVPAGPAGLQAGPPGVTQVRMHHDRMMHRRMMRHRMMHHDRMMHRRMVRRRMMHRM